LNIPGPHKGLLKFSEEFKTAESGGFDTFWQTWGGKFRETFIALVLSYFYPLFQTQTIACYGVLSNHVVTSQTASLSEVCHLAQLQTTSTSHWQLELRAERYTPTKDLG
jgi:hypothetical protein